MDKIARFAILSLFPFTYGNGNCRKSRFNSRVTRRVFSFFCFYFRASLWLFCLLSSPALIAEFSSDDSDNLLLISQEVFNIHTDTQGIYSQIKMINDDTDNILKLYQSLGYTNYTAGQGTLKQDILVLRDYLSALSGQQQSIMKGMGSLSQTTWYGETLGEKLDKIITAIESLDNSGGSGSETPEIPTDIATETTLSAFKGQYEQLANQFLNSWGFSQELTYKDSISPFFEMFNGWTDTNQYQHYTRGGRPTADTVDAPFPNVSATSGWMDTSTTDGSVTSSWANPFVFLAKRANIDAFWTQNVITENMKKSAWNDWYAHTNLVDTLYTLSSPPKNYIDSSSDIGSIDSSTGEMTLTYNDSEGGSPPTSEVIDTKVVYTNDFSVLQTDSNLIGDNLNKITYSKLNDKYKLPEGIEKNNYQDYSSKEALPDYTLQYGPKQYQSFKFTAKHRTMYNSIFSPQLCDKLRGVFSKLWFFLSIWFNFVLFKIFGKVKE